MIGIAAMLSTASAINATLYGSARMTYTIVKTRELPAQLDRPIWNRPIEGLLITAAATVVLANVLTWPPSPPWAAPGSSSSSPR